MILTALYFLYLGALMIITLVLAIPYFLLQLFRSRKILNRYVHFISSMWARHVIWMTGSRVKVTGLENIPKADNLCFISNHQGMTDIVLVIGYIPKVVGFIAKKELARVPIISFWMSVIHCILLDRGNKKKTIEAMQRGVESIRSGHPMLIFPEGTRSRGMVMGPFKPGSLNLATRAQAIIVPLTVNGAYGIFEEHKRVKARKVSLKIHPPIDLSKEGDVDNYALAERLWGIVHGGLGEPAAAGELRP
jgi:1-acyl-sn-glycerol-3-phosphate acyltransferase